MTKISVNEVTKKYADHTALDRMCIDIPEQCIYGLLGPNGAGKTTLIRILNQITAPDTGEVLINGEKLTKRYTQYSELKAAAAGFDVFMVGSDQVWNPHYLCGKDPAYYLSFTNSPNKLSYASSIGTSSLSESEIKELIQKTSQFKSISLRENESVQMLHQAGDTRSQYVLDPVFLHDVGFYRAIQSKKKESGYILAYIMQKDPFIAEVTEAIAKKLNKKVIQIGGFASKCTCDKFPRSAGPAEFLSLIDGADFVVTSSFHGTAFSHIYHKQFAVVHLMIYHLYLRINHHI